MTQPARPRFGVVLIAPPGAGKGTQGRRLADHYQLELLSTGELLRAEAAAGTATGRLAAAYLERGDLVPQEIVIEVLSPRLIRAGSGNGYVLDGFPRSPAQAEAADRLIAGNGLASIEAVLHLLVRPEELATRLAVRALNEGRSDDTELTFAHRVAVYEAETEPVLAFYEARGLVVHTDGERPVDEVTADILVAIDARLAASA